VRAGIITNVCAVAELRKQELQVTAVIPPVLPCGVQVLTCAMHAAAENQAETMALLAKVIAASSKKQDEMLEKLGNLNKMAAHNQHSKELQHKVNGLNRQVEKLGTIKKLADITGGIGAQDDDKVDGGGSPKAAASALTFTPPSLDDLRSSVGGKKEDL
jgi:hypothetical protein